MARLTAAEHEAFSREWLNIWAQAGRPVIRADATHDVRRKFGREAISFDGGHIVLEHNGKYAQQTYGVASLIRVSANGTTITDLVCALAGERLTAGDLVAVRSGGGVQYDLEYLARRIERFHIEAALRCVDPTALHGLTGRAATEALAKIQAKVIRAEISDGASTAKPCNTMRL